MIYYEFVFEDNKLSNKYKEDYMCDLLANGFDEFVEMLKEFIPQLTSEPYFIAGVPEDSDEEEE